MLIAEKPPVSFDEENRIEKPWSFEEKLQELSVFRRSEIDEIVLSNGTVVRIAVSYRSRFPRQYTEHGSVMVPCCLGNDSLRRLCAYFFADSWFVQDFCGFVCCVLTWALIVYAACVLTYLIIFVTPHALQRFVLIVLMWVVAITSVRCHILAMLTNPGARPLHDCTESNLMSLPANSEVAICWQCASIKPSRTHHCRVCNRCVHRMDHHCPWINNCVGQGNQKHFVLFTLYVFFLCVISVGIMLLTAFRCIDDNNISINSKCEAWFVNNGVLIAILSLAMETALFGMFTLMIMCSQLVSIATDETKIDSSDVRLSCRDRIENFENVFGGKCSYRWFLPSHVGILQYRGARSNSVV